MTPNPRQLHYPFYSPMFEDIVSSLLSKYLGDYLEGLSKKDLKISLWKGDVELTNLVNLLHVL